MSSLPRRLKSIFRTRRGAPRKELNEAQAHVLRQNLRAILTSKEYLAQQKKPASF